MEGNIPVIDFKYCLLHGKNVLVEKNGFGNWEHFEEIGSLPCHGPFAEIPPPPSLTEEEWKQILEPEKL